MPIPTLPVKTTSAPLGLVVLIPTLPDEVITNGLALAGLTWNSCRGFDPPIPTFPDEVTMPLGSLIPLLKVWMPVQLLALVKSREMEVDPPRETDPPPLKPDVPVTLKAPLPCRYEFRMELLSKDNPDETVRDPPIPTLPVDETVKAVDPELTWKSEVGEVKPIPTLPPVTTNLPPGDEVPIPKFELVLSQ